MFVCASHIYTRDCICIHENRMIADAGKNKVNNVLFVMILKNINIRSFGRSHGK